MTHRVNVSAAMSGHLSLIPRSHVHLTLIDFPLTTTYVHTHTSINTHTHTHKTNSSINQNTSCTFPLEPPNRSKMAAPCLPPPFCKQENWIRCSSHVVNRFHTKIWIQKSDSRFSHHPELMYYVIILQQRIMLLSWSQCNYIIPTIMDYNLKLKAVEGEIKKLSSASWSLFLFCGIWSHHEKLN